MRSTPRCEQETIIQWAADEQTATVSTSNPAIIRRLDKLAEAVPEEYTRVFELTDIRDARYTMPVKLLRFGKPASEATRERGRRTLANLRNTPGNYREIDTSSESVDRLQE